MAGDVEIGAWLGSLGFDSAGSRGSARNVLEESGLTRPGKLRMSEGKLFQARDALEAALFRVCENGECRDLARRLGAGRELVLVSATSCKICGGSNNRRAVRTMGRSLRAHGVERLLIVGGTPAQHAEMREILSSGDLAVRFVDGEAGSHSRRDAGPHLEWAQMLVVWGATPLPHKVSRLYTDDPPAHLRGRTVKLAKRGVEALCREVMRSLR